VKKSFKTLYCEQHACSEEDYDQHVFRRCLNLHAVPVANMLSQWAPAFFREDFDFVREVGFVTTRGELICELNRFYGRNLRDRNWFRRELGLRISGKRVLRLYRRLVRGDHSRRDQEVSAPSKAKA
jgi:hypothetical protein